MSKLPESSRCYICGKMTPVGMFWNGVLDRSYCIKHMNEDPGARFSEDSLEFWMAADKQREEHESSNLFKGQHARSG